MTPQNDNAQNNLFQTLTPDIVLHLVETSLDCRCTNLCNPLNSYINRVYELKTADDTGLVVKFYRPGRWSKKGLQDEHDFLLELHELEIPVIAPLKLSDGATLGTYNNIHFAVFPKMGGRSFDEFNDDQWLELGHLLGRVHNVGATHAAGDRIILAPDRSTRDQVEYILQGDFMDTGQARKFTRICHELLADITPLFQHPEMIRIHGDCHFSNLIYRPGESFYLIDFDDMATGPPIQDIWMLLPGYLHECLAEMELFLEGYETFRRFDRRTLRLIEPLRAMRYIHFTAWCAHQVEETGLSRVAPDFGSHEYWQKEIRDLTEQRNRILQSLQEDALYI